MASTALRKPVGHDDRLSLVDHLDELRSRLIVSLIALVAAVMLCFAFNGTLLDVINKPLDKETQKNVNKGRGPLGQVARVEQSVRGLGTEVDKSLVLLSARDSGLPARTRAALARQ